MELEVIEAPCLEELHRLMAVAHALLCDDDMRPLELLGRRRQPVDEQVTDRLLRLDLLDDDVHRRLALLDDLRVDIAVERHDEFEVLRVVFELQDEVEVIHCRLADLQALAFVQDFCHKKNTPFLCFVVLDFSFFTTIV